MRSALDLIRLQTAGVVDGWGPEEGKLIGDSQSSKVLLCKSRNIKAQKGTI
jgi:hypothetical protein